MKIAHLTDYYLPRLGGIEIQVHDLAQRQRDAGHEVEVITPTRRRNGVGSGAPVAGVRVHRLGGPPVHPGTAAQVRRLLAAGDPEVVHVHAGVLSPFAYVGLRTALRAGIPTLVTVHSLWGYTVPGFRLLDRRLHWSRWPMEISAVSEVAAAPIRRIAGPDREVAVIPNGVEPRDWAVDPLPRNPNDVHLVAAMRLAPRKRPLALLRILRRVRNHLPGHIQLTATIIGEGPQRPLLEAYLARHRMSGWVSLPGRYSRERIRAAYRRSDVFVAPANLESFGIAALEARCAGLPVVAKAHTGIREFVADGEEGLLVSSDEEMAFAVARLARSAALRERIAGYNRSMPATVSWVDVLARYEAAYKRACDVIN